MKLFSVAPAFVLPAAIGGLTLYLPRPATAVAILCMYYAVVLDILELIKIPARTPIARESYI